MAKYTAKGIVRNDLMFKTVVFDIHDVCCTSCALTIVTKWDFGGFF